MTAAGDMPLPQPQTQAIPVPAIDIAKPPSISKNRFIMNPNLNLPSNHQTALIAGTQVSMSINQQLPSTVQNSVAVGEGLSPQTSTKGVGLSDEAKQYLTRWLLTSSNPYLYGLKEKIIRYFCIENFRSLDGFMTRKNIQNKQTDRWKGKYLYLAAKQVPTTLCSKYA